VTARRCPFWTVIDRPLSHVDRTAGRLLSTARAVDRQHWPVTDRPEEATVLGRRLYEAAHEAFGPLEQFGFRPVNMNLAWWRGARMTFANEAVVIAINADWLEGELDVSVREIGGAGIVFPSIHVDRDGTFGWRHLHRSPSKGVLTATLSVVSDAVIAHLPDALKDGAGGH
jgi:hypothetical protein